MKTVSLKCCQTPFEAGLIKAKLNDAGINCFLTNESYSALYPTLGKTFGTGVQVMIDEDDLEKALEVLADEPTE